MSKELTIPAYSTVDLTLIEKDENNHLFCKETSFRLHKNALDTGILSIMSIVQMMI